MLNSPLHGALSVVLSLLVGRQRKFFDVKWNVGGKGIMKFVLRNALRLKGKPRCAVISFRALNTYGLTPLFLTSADKTKRERNSKRVPCIIVLRKLRKSPAKRLILVSSARAVNYTSGGIKRIRLQ